MKPRLPALLSINGRDLDTAGFLALHGSFTAHVTGNFVTFAAATVLGTFECCVYWRCRSLAWPFRMPCIAFISVRRRRRR